MMSIATDSKDSKYIAECLLRIRKELDNVLDLCENRANYLTLPQRDDIYKSFFPYSDLPEFRELVNDCIVIFKNHANLIVRDEQKLAKTRFNKSIQDDFPIDE